MSGDIEYTVRVNGEDVGRVWVPVGAGKRELELAALSLPEANVHIAESTIKSFSVQDDRVIDIVA